MLVKMFFQAQELFKKDEGQGLIEYALIVLLISIAVIVVLELIGIQLDDVFDQILAALGGGG